jgi:Chromo (CHRromatin Organisation MOdifier) domain
MPGPEIGAIAPRGRRTYNLRCSPALKHGKNYMRRDSTQRLLLLLLWESLVLEFHPCPIKNRATGSPAEKVGLCREYQHAGEPKQESELLLERIVGARQMANGTLLYLIRWFGYGLEDDTWLPVEYLPKLIVRRYHRRTRLPYPQ